MMKVQQFLREGNSLEHLNNKYGINCNYHKTKKLVILNYDQIESPKLDDIVRECRALILEIGSWDVVARSFPRFFNYGEVPEIDNKFNWDNFSVEEKLDGSLMLLHWYDNQWISTTRGSWADCPILPGSPTWSEVFLKLINQKEFDNLDKTVSYSFEFCTKYNRVVKQHAEDHLVLLSAFHNKSGHELNEYTLDAIAGRLGVKRPERYNIKSIDDALAHIDGKDAQFEGMVFRDHQGIRLKVKNARYVALHHLKDNGNGFSRKNLLSLILKNETDEVLIYFNDIAEDVYSLIEKINGEKYRMIEVYKQAKKFEKQKDFAIYIQKHTKLSSLLFNARKYSLSPEEIWRDSHDLLIKLFLNC